MHDGQRTDVSRPSCELRQREFPHVVVFSAVDDDVVVGVANSEAV